MSLATSASEMPVLPLVGSSSSRPGSSSPEASAPRSSPCDAVLDRAGRVLALELRVEADARLGERRGSSTSGRVADEIEQRRRRARRSSGQARRGELPRRRVAPLPPPRRAAGHRRKEDHGGVCPRRRVEPVERADVLALDVDVRRTARARRPRRSVRGAREAAVRSSSSSRTVAPRRRPSRSPFVCVAKRRGMRTVVMREPRTPQNST